MVKIITLEEAQEIICANHSNSEVTFNILFSEKKDPLLNKIKLVNKTIGSQFSLRTKIIKTGIMGTVNDIKYLDKRVKELYSFICVPQDVAKLYSEELKSCAISNIYIIK